MPQAGFHKWQFILPPIVFRTPCFQMIQHIHRQPFEKTWEIRSNDRGKISRNPNDPKQNAFLG